MVGDSTDSDVQGALNAGLGPSPYSLKSQFSQTVRFGEEIPVIAHMEQLLDYLRIAN